MDPETRTPGVFLPKDTCWVRCPLNLPVCRVWGCRLRIVSKSLGLKVWRLGLGFRVQGSGFD